MKNEAANKMKTQDRAAFDAFCRESYPALLAYARVFLSEEWAQDVVQDVFFTLWQKRDTLVIGDGIRSYMFKSVHNRCVNCLRNQDRSRDFRKWNENRITEMALEAGDYDRNPVIRKLYDGDLRTSLKAAIESLPPRCREVFRLSYIEDCSAKEISSRLGISVRTVENHMHAALKHLRSRLRLENVYTIAVFAAILRKIL